MSLKCQYPELLYNWVLDSARRGGVVVVVVVKGVGKEEGKGKSHISNYFQFFFQVSSIQRKALH